MGYATGFGAVQEAIKKANDRENNSFTIEHPVQNPYKLNWSEKEGNVHIIRFVTDNIIGIGFHDFIRGVNGKPNEYVNTEELQGELRRPDWIAANLTDDKGNPRRPTKKFIGLAIERELNEETGEYDDVYRKFTVDDPDNEGEKKEVWWPAFWIIKQGTRFWDQVNAHWTLRKTITDRDYMIQRSGKTAQNTSYAVIPMDKYDGPNSAEELAEHYQIPVIKGYEHDSDPDHIDYGRIAQGHIAAWIERRGTVRWFDQLTGSSNDEQQAKPKVDEAPSITKRGIDFSKLPPKKEEAFPAHVPNVEPVPVSVQETPAKEIPFRDRLMQHSSRLGK